MDLVLLLLSLSTLVYKNQPGPEKGKWILCRNDERRYSPTCEQHCARCANLLIEHQCALNKELSARCKAAEDLLELNTLDNTQLILKWMDHYGLRELVEAMAPEAWLEFSEEWISTPSTTKETTMAMIQEIKNRHTASTMDVLPTSHERIAWALRHHVHVYDETGAGRQNPSVRKRRGTFTSVLFRTAHNIS